MFCDEICYLTACLNPQVGVEKMYHLVLPTLISEQTSTILKVISHATN